jgi:hypothetical protein
MAEKPYRAAWDAETPPFGIQELLRVAIWGGLAAAALLLAVVSSYSGAGSPRQPVAGTSGQAGVPQKTSAADAAAPAAALAEAANETRRLAEAVHTLTADREQMLTRIASLERSLDDVTGTIRRDAQQAPPQVTSIGSAAPSARTEKPAPPPTETPIIPAQTPGSQPSGSIEAAPDGAPDTAARTAATPAAPTHTTALAEAPAGTAGLGLDVGGAVNFDGLRALWSSTKHSLLAPPEELYPVVAVRENSKTRSADLRLIIGPIPNAEAAARLCVALATAHRYCQPAAFEGQRLLLIEPLSKPIPNTVHRPAAAPPQP